ncbi:MAG: hypothetical protein GX846_04935, partial [Deltaproteobacteria bacterium]|nr:hypothetical protein [Deltaproteobacteria bacterium]
MGKSSCFHPNGGSLPKKGEMLVSGLWFLDVLRIIKYPASSIQYHSSTSIYSSFQFRGVSKLFLRLIIRKYLYFAFLVICILMLGSCSYLKKVREYYEAPALMTVPEEKVRQIDMMDLKKVEQTKETKVVPAESEPGDITLSLAECRAFTLENNLDLRVQLINPSIASEEVNQEEAKFEAIYSGKIEYNNTDMPQSSLLDGTGINQHIANIGVNMPLRTGGTLSFNIVDSRRKETSVWTLLNPSYYTAPS